jgi:hypothetical protein
MRELGTDGHTLLDGNQIRPHQLTGASKQGDGGEPDHSGREQVADRWAGLQGLEEHRPAQRAAVIAGGGHRQREQQPGPVEPREGGGSQVPIKAPERRMRAEEPHHEGAGEHGAGHPFPRMTANRSSSPGSAPKKLACRKD